MVCCLAERVALIVCFRLLSCPSPPVMSSMPFDATLAAANELFVADEFDGAAALYDAAVTQQPNNTQALVARAHNNIKLKQYNGQPHTHTHSHTHSHTLTHSHNTLSIEARQ